MMFEIAVREKGLVQPIAIRYWNSQGEVSHKAAFIDDDGIMQSIGRLLLEKTTYAQVHYLPAMDASKMNRKELRITANLPFNIAWINPALRKLL